MPLPDDVTSSDESELTDVEGNAEAPQFSEQGEHQGLDESSCLLLFRLLAFLFRLPPTYLPTYLLLHLLGGLMGVIVKGIVRAT